MHHFPKTAESVVHVYRGSRRNAGFGVLLRTLEIGYEQHNAAIDTPFSENSRIRRVFLPWVTA
jgi:hypothetical protein